MRPADCAAFSSHKMLVICKEQGEEKGKEGTQSKKLSCMHN